jgi:hypothetical protein
MSTSACVCKLQSDGSVSCIVVNYDGYPSGVGAVLVEHYSHPEQRIDHLLALGDLSSLGASLASPPVPAEDGYTVAYCRDRGEDWADVFPGHFDSVDAALAEYVAIDYFYLWEESKGWRCVGRFGRQEDVPIPRRKPDLAKPKEMKIHDASLANLDAQRKRLVSEIQEFEAVLAVRTSTLENLNLEIAAAKATIGELGRHLVELSKY